MNPSRTRSARRCCGGVVILPLFLLCSLASAQESDAQDTERTAREAMSSRINDQLQFVVQRRNETPPASSEPEVIRSWLDAAENDWAERAPARTSRLAAFSPYIWSWAPHWLNEADSDDEVFALTHAQRLVPALLDDIDAVVRGSEPGVGQLLRRPDLGNSISRRTLAAGVDITALRRLRIQTGQLEAAMRRVRQESKDLELDMPEHLYQAVGALQRFSKSVQIEIELRIKRRAQAFVGLSSVAVAGRTPPGFRNQATRLARAYAESNEIDAALAVLDMAALSVSGAAWSDQEMRELYEEVAQTKGRIRFWTVADRRPFALIPSKTKFDPKQLVDLETGQPLTYAQFNKRILVLVFWSRGCGPCLEEIPHLQEFAEQYPKEVLVVGVLSQASDNPEADLAAVRERGGRYPVARQVDRAGGGPTFSVQGTPCYVVVRPDGVVLKPFGETSSPTYSFADVESTVIRMVRGEMR